MVHVCSSQVYIHSWSWQHMVACCTRPARGHREQQTSICSKQNKVLPVPSIATCAYCNFCLIWTISFLFTCNASISLSLLFPAVTDIYISEPVLYAILGSNKSITAVYTSPSTPIVTWYFNGAEVDTASSPRYTASLANSKMAVLNIANVAEDVLGSYMVVIGVGVTNQSDSVRLLYPGELELVCMQTHPSICTK